MPPDTIQHAEIMVHGQSTSPAPLECTHAQSTKNIDLIYTTAFEMLDFAQEDNGLPSPDPHNLACPPNTIRHAKIMAHTHPAFP
ncbi:hypothetical protein RSAG8_11448, partial [Rhizoctonia solani AG-8 WAC10335]